MQQLHPHTGTAKRVAYGMAVRGRLLRTKQAALAAPFEAAFEAVRAEARRVEDLEAEVQYACVARKGVALSLSREARQLRLRLAARSLDAVKKAPYTEIFPGGLRPLTEAPVREVVVRYMALAQRIELALAPDDPLRAETVARLRAGVQAYREATTQLERVRAAMRLARGVRDSAVMDSVEQTWVLYGTLLARLGKKKAEQIMRIPGKGGVGRRDRALRIRTDRGGAMWERKDREDREDREDRARAARDRRGQQIHRWAQLLCHGHPPPPPLLPLPAHARSPGPERGERGVLSAGSGDARRALIARGRRPAGARRAKRWGWRGGEDIRAGSGVGSRSGR